MVGLQIPAEMHTVTMPSQTSLTLSFLWVTSFALTTVKKKKKKKEALPPE